MSLGERVDPETVDERVSKALEASDAWESVTELQHQLSQLQTVGFDVTAEVNDHISEAREEIAYAKLLIWHEVFTDTLESLEEGGES